MDQDQAATISDKMWETGDTEDFYVYLCGLTPREVGAAVAVACAGAPERADMVRLIGALLNDRKNLDDGLL